jgi:hypothetical protein
LDRLRECAQRARIGERLPIHAGIAGDEISGEQ